MKKLFIFLSLGVVAIAAGAFISDTSFVDMLSSLVFGSGGLTLGVIVATTTPATQERARNNQNTQQLAIAQSFNDIAKPIPDLSSFVITVNNSHTSANKTAMLWNSGSLITGVSTDTEITITKQTGGATYANFNLLFKTNPIIIPQMQMEVEDTLQFSQTFTRYVGNGIIQDTDPSFNAYIQGLKSPMYLNNKILIIPMGPFKLRSLFEAWTVSVLPDSTITFTFSYLSKSMIQF